MSTAAQPVAPSQKSLPKVLRLGLLKDGKVSERITKIGEVVTVGESPRNLFVLAEPRLGQKLDMFIPQRDGYLLQVPEWVEGMVQTKDGMKSLIALRSTAQKKGELWVYTLDERMRGKLVVGGHSVLFQFVPAPPQPERAMSAADFRAKWYDDEDPLFLALLGTFSIVSACFMTWVLNTERPSDEDLVDVDDAARLIVKEIEAIALPPEPTAVGEEPPETQEPAAAEPEKAPASPSSTPNDAPPSVEQQVASSVVIQALGTLGLGTSGTTALDMIGDDQALGSLQDKLAGVSGTEQANATNILTKGGGSGAGTDASVGVNTAKQGDASVGTAAVVKIKKPKVDYGNADADVEEGDVGNIASVVKKRSGSFQSCTEAGLKQDENMSGRVTIGWTITAGRVSGAKLLNNTTGNAGVGACFLAAISTLRFDEGLTGEVAGYTWTVSGV